MEVECTSYFSTPASNVQTAHLFEWRAKLPDKVKITVEPEHPVIHGDLHFKAVWTEHR